MLITYKQLGLRHTNKLFAHPSQYLLLTLFACMTGSHSVPSYADEERQINLDDQPPTVSTSAPPNVILLLDNSGSMNNIDWYTTQAEDGLTPFSPNPATPYTDWSRNKARWDPASKSVILNEITEKISCPSTGSGYAIGLNNPVADASPATKCLYLPDPLGSGNTYYDGQYLNYLFSTFPTGADLADPATAADYAYVPKLTRLAVQKTVATDIIESNQSINFGLASFNNQFDVANQISDGINTIDIGGHGAKILNNCGADKASIIDSIDTISATSGGATPLAESLYEMTRYFRGLESGYGTKQGGGVYPSPIESACQKNFAIVLTDGLPTHDSNFQFADATNEMANKDTGLPDWDNYTTTGGQAYSDGDPAYAPITYTTGVSADPARVTHETSLQAASAPEGATAYLDDIAKFAYDTDMKSGAGFDTAPFAKQNMKTLVVGFTVDNQLLQDTAHYGSGRSREDDQITSGADSHYFTAADQVALERELQQAVTSIRSQVSSATSITANASFASGLAGNDVYLFQARFSTNTDTHPDDWTGNLHAFKLTNANTGALVSASNSAAEVLNNRLVPASRKIFTYNPYTRLGTPFIWGNNETLAADKITAIQKTQLHNKEEILDYIRGHRGCEKGSNTSCQVGEGDNTKVLPKVLRKRSSLLGSIVNSAPVFIHLPQSRYPDNAAWPNGPEAEGTHETYSAFKERVKDRPAMIYVGANDGMLHAFSAAPAEAGGPPSLVEKFAYIPDAVFDNLPNLASDEYTHKYYVDGTPTVMDVFFDGSRPVGNSNVSGDNRWHTVLVGGLGKGGKAIYALDVTDPEDFDKTKVLWEFQHRNMDYSYSRPAIVRMNNGKWVAVFGSGYENEEPRQRYRQHYGHWYHRYHNHHYDSIYQDSCYNNPVARNDEATLFFVDIQTGQLIRQITVDDDRTSQERAIRSVVDHDYEGDSYYHGRRSRYRRNNRKYSNGLSTPAPIDSIDNDYVVDYVYAGDLRGNLWRLDVTSSNACDWKVSGPGNPATDKPIFTAEYFDHSDAPDQTLYYRQPITTRPEVSRADGTNLMIHFGTGTFFGTLDRLNTNIQSFYGILDNTSAASVLAARNPINRLDSSNFIQQVIQAETSVDFTVGDTTSTQEVREFSQKVSPDIRYTSWYLDFDRVVPSTGTATELTPGERIVSSPLVRGSGSAKRVIFNTIVPTNGACEFGGKSWLVELKANNGNRTSDAVFDLNYDGAISALDNGLNNGERSTVYNGWSQTGLQARPTIISSDEKEFKYFSGSTGSINVLTEALPEINKGRQSWRQIK